MSEVEQQQYMVFFLSFLSRHISTWIQLTTSKGTDNEIDSSSVHSVFSLKRKNTQNVIRFKW